MNSGSFKKIIWVLAGFFLFSLSSCRDEGKLIIIEDNNPPPYEGIPTILIENYVNRLYIDLIGREPTDAEMQSETDFLKSQGLQESARYNLISKLQSNTTYQEGDSSFFIAYYHRLYELWKGRFIEGASNEDIESEIGIFEYALLGDSLTGNTQGVEANRAIIRKFKAVIQSEFAYRKGEIKVEDVFERMLNNALYDKINMNTFNFIRASFQDIFGRYPTDSEYNDCYNTIEYSTAGTLFGVSCSNKDEYITILTHSREAKEGIIRWAYSTLLAREAKTAEVFKAMQDFNNTGNFQKVQADILVTDEYAGFN
ncbi:MAG: hypothetical protein K1X92_06595 [Bacteroidia bacterium]|nr:hypothetical protein [Bacteroidia bacterium]